MPVEIAPGDGEYLKRSGSSAVGADAAQLAADVDTAGVFQRQDALDTDTAALVADSDSAVKAALDAQYATVAQGELADTAVQPGDLGTAATADATDFVPQAAASATEPPSPSTNSLWFDPNPSWAFRTDRLVLGASDFDLEGSTRISFQTVDKWQIIRLDKGGATQDAFAIIDPVAAGVTHWQTCKVSAIYAPTSDGEGVARLRHNINAFSAGDVASTPSILTGSSVLGDMPGVSRQIAIKQAPNAIEVDGSALLWHFTIDRDGTHATDTYADSVDLIAVILDRIS